METKKQIRFQMRISSINVLRFSIHELTSTTAGDGGAFEHKSDFRLKILEESNEIGIEMTVNIRVKETGELFSDLTVLMKFEIQPFNKVVVKNEDNTFNIPDTVVSNLSHVTVGTVRGILYERLKGTVKPFEIFPLLDINQMFAERDRYNGKNSDGSLPAESSS